MMKTSKNDLTALTEASDNHQHSEEAEVETMISENKNSIYLSEFTLNIKQKLKHQSGFEEL